MIVTSVVLRTQWVSAIFVPPACFHISLVKHIESSEKNEQVQQMLAMHLHTEIHLSCLKYISQIHSNIFSCLSTSLFTSDAEVQSAIRQWLRACSSLFALGIKKLVDRWHKWMWTIWWQWKIFMFKCTTLLLLLIFLLLSKSLTSELWNRTNFALTRLVLSTTEVTVIKFTNFTKCRQRNSQQSIYFRFFIPRRMAEWHHFVTYLWYDPNTRVSHAHVEQ